MLSLSSSAKLNIHLSFWSLVGHELKVHDPLNSSTIKSKIFASINTVLNV
jgi:hypothetical protein